MADQKTGFPPVSLAAGSYDAAKLSKGLDAAAAAKDDQVTKAEGAVLAAQAGTNTGQSDPALLPDHVYVDMENGHSGTERRQVYAPTLEGAHVGAETGNTGTVVETDDAAEKRRAAAIEKAIKTLEPPPAAAEPAVAESGTGQADPVLAEAAIRPAAAAPAAPNTTTK